MLIRRLEAMATMISMKYLGHLSEAFKVEFRIKLIKGTMSSGCLQQQGMQLNNPQHFFQS